MQSCGLEIWFVDPFVVMREYQVSVSFAAQVTVVTDLQPTSWHDL
jgi:hypothetical protein